MDKISGETPIYHIKRTDLEDTSAVSWPCWLCSNAKGTPTWRPFSALRPSPASAIAFSSIHAAVTGLARVVAREWSTQEMYRFDIVRVTTITREEVL